jgi:hypothetical protein
MLSGAHGQETCQETLEDNLLTLDQIFLYQACLGSKITCGPIIKGMRTRRELQARCQYFPNALCLALQTSLHSMFNCC